MGQSVFDVVTHLAPQPKRFLNREVIEECGSAQIFCVQELLSFDAQRFFDRLAQTHFSAAMRDHNRPRLISMRGSGLGVATSVNPLQKILVPFSSRGVGWDSLARKGSLYSQLEFEGKRIDLLTVHLQAGNTEACRTVRSLQLKEIASLIIQFGSPERHFIVCGDFNIQGKAHARADAEYENLMRSLDGFIDLGAEADLATYHPHPDGNLLASAFEPEGAPQRLDYIFLRPASRVANVKVSDVQIFFDRPLASLGHGVAGWASDHYGLRATLEI